MSYQYGYQQQSPPQYGGYQGGYPEPGAGANPTLAIIAGLLGLAAVGALLVVNFNQLGDMAGASFGDLPGEFQTVVVLRFAAAAVLLIGAVIVFIRKLAGAIVLVLGALAGISAILLYPVLLADFLGGQLDLGSYLEEIFKFDGTFATFSAVALIAAPLALILVILPPSLSYLKGSAPSGGYDGYPQQGW